MIEKINDNLLNTTPTALQETQNISASTIKNAYKNDNKNLIDETDISQEAVDLYRREQEINKYTKYLDDVSEQVANNKVIDLMEKGIINISDEELANSMFSDISLLNELFG